MGVKGLWKIINKCGEELLPHNITLAIDTSIWVHQYKGMSERDAIYYISKKIIKLLFYKINPVFIFDGPPNPLKRKVIEERKKENINGLIKDIINNVICKKCKISIRMCPHGGLIKDDFVEGSITGHKIWGDTFEDEKNNFKIRNTENEDLYNDDFNKNKNIIEYLESKEHSDTQKLKMLVKMRERRKNRLYIDNSSLIGFSNSQLKNIKKRNLVSFYIKKLENEKSKKIGSDRSKSFVLEKQDKEKIEMKNDFDESSETELNNFLEIDTLQTKTQDINKYYSFSEEKKNARFDSDTVVVCNTISDKSADGYFGQLKSESVDEIEEVKNEINYHFKTAIPVNAQIQNEYKNETMDFLSIQSIIKDILNTFNLPHLDSPSESDAQCAFLSKMGVVDGVITEDNDILLHGGIVYKNFFRKNKAILRYDPKKIEEILGLTVSDLIDLGFVLGSDYTVGVKGIGIKKAVEFIKTEEFRNLDTKLYRNIYNSCSVREDFRPRFKTIEVDKILRYWTNTGMEKERIDELYFFLSKNN